MTKKTMCQCWQGTGCAVSDEISPCKYHGPDFECKIKGDLSGKETMKTPNDRGEDQLDLENPLMRSKYNTI